MPAVLRRSAFIYLYIFDSNYSAEAQYGTLSVRALNVYLKHEFTGVLYLVSSYVQPYISFREWALKYQASTPYQRVIHLHRHSTSQHARR